MSAWAPFTTTTYALPSLRSSVAARCRTSDLGFCRDRGASLAHHSAAVVVRSRCPALRDCYAAVDDDGLAGDVSGGAGSKPDKMTCDGDPLSSDAR